jgi:glycosyltransferase involved in cell wall biosynthesis
MHTNANRVRVLYSFPNKLGGARICYTAWQQVNGLAAAGAEVLVCAASACRPIPAGAVLRPTLARGTLRLPFKVFGRRRARAIHDHLVARRLEKLAGRIDIVHLWPGGGLRTMEVARRLGIPTVLERCNSHTGYVYEVVQREAERLGVRLAPGDEAAFNADTLRMEEQEFHLVDRLLCPSDFVVRTLLDKGFSADRLARHIYGFDDQAYFPGPAYQPNSGGLRMLFVGVGAVRKGLHFALEAWLNSNAHQRGTFSIAGTFFPEYEAKLAPMLAHPSVRVLGQRNDVPELMRSHDILALPSLEEGFGLVCTEAMGSGCVPLVSDACTDFCRHRKNSLVHRVGDVKALTQHITVLDQDRNLLQTLRTSGLELRSEMTWGAAGIRLLDAYRETIAMHLQSKLPVHGAVLQTA